MITSFNGHKASKCLQYVCSHRKVALALALTSFDGMSNEKPIETDKKITSLLSFDDAMCKMYDKRVRDLVSFQKENSFRLIFCAQFFVIQSQSFTNSHLLTTNNSASCIAFDHLICKFSVIIFGVTGITNEQ